MSTNLYEVLSLAARYLFTLLGVLIVLRSFVWLLSDHQEKHSRLRRLPDAGMIGEMVVLSGSRELPEGMAVPVPWEGILGSVRSCDMVIPCPEVRKRHLRFSYENGLGLKIMPLSGCEATVNGVLLNCRSGEKAAPMTHGSFLQIGSTVLRLRVFAGLDSAAGFGDEPGIASPSAPGMPEEAYTSPQGFPVANVGAVPPSDFQMPQGSVFLPEAGSAVPVYTAAEADINPNGAPLPAPTDSSAPENKTGCASPAPRRRRSDRWEADWSE